MIDTWSVGLFEEPGRRVAGVPSRGSAAISRATTAMRARSEGSSRSSTWTAWRSCASTTTAQCLFHGARRLSQRRRAPLSRRSAADRGHPARGLEPGSGGPCPPLGPVAAAHRLQPARVADAARARLRGGRRQRAAARRAPALDRRARHPLCRHQSDRGLQERLRHRRVRPRHYVNSLQLGCDCLGEILYLDAVVHDSRGRAQTIENAICVHEEDAGILWKHSDWRTGATDVRRSRRLVISSIATVGNYEYGFYWYLSLDGAIGVRGASSPASCTRPASSRARSPARPRSSRRASARATTSTSSAHDSTWMSTASATRFSRSTPGRPRRADEPVRPRVHRDRRRSRASSPPSG